MNFEVVNTSIPIDEKAQLVFDLTSIQDATGNSLYSKLVGEPLRRDQNLTFLLDHFTELSVLGERTSSNEADKFSAVENIL